MTPTDRQKMAFELRSQGKTWSEVGALMAVTAQCAAQLATASGMVVGLPKGTIDLSNRRFERLRVIRYTDTRNGEPYWQCRCVCGKIVEVRGKRLRSGRTKSCGCYRSDPDVRRSAHPSHRPEDRILALVWDRAKQCGCRVKSAKIEEFGRRSIEINGQRISVLPSRSTHQPDVAEYTHFFVRRLDRPYICLVVDVDEHPVKIFVIPSSVLGSPKAVYIPRTDVMGTHSHSQSTERWLMYEEKWPEPKQ